MYPFLINAPVKILFLYWLSLKFNYNQSFLFHNREAKQLPLPPAHISYSWSLTSDSVRSFTERNFENVKLFRIFSFSNIEEQVLMLFHFIVERKREED